MTGSCARSPPSWRSIPSWDRAWSGAWRAMWIMSSIEAAAFVVSVALLVLLALTAG